MVWGRGEESEDVNERVRCGGVGGSWDNCPSGKEARLAAVPPGPRGCLAEPARGQGGRGGTTAGPDAQDGSTAAGAARGGGSLCPQRLQKQLSSVESFLSHDGNLKKKKAFILYCFTVNSVVTVPGEH